MIQSTRLFDCLTVQAQAPLPDLLNAKEGGVWRPYATTEIHDLVNRLSSGLLEKGISSGDMTIEGRDKVGLICSSRPEWLITDLATQQIGAILVPLYPTTNEKDIESIFKETNVKIVFVENKEIFEKIHMLKSSIPSIQYILSIDEIPGIPYWKDLMPSSVAPQQLNRIKEISDLIMEDDLATIIYTSGTTGQPKGVMLTHKNIMSNIHDTRGVLEDIHLPVRRALSFLPLNHIFEKMVTYVYLFNGFTIYYAQSMETIASDLRESKPFIFTSVPRLLEKVYERILITGQQLTGIKRKLFFWALSLANCYKINTRQSVFYKLQMYIADKLIFSKWRAAIGGNVKAIVLGGAACQPKMARIFSAAGITIMEGYGLTETSPVIAVNGYPQRKRRFGTVGPVLESVMIRFEPDGEICCKGDNVMPGYYKHPELTAEVLKDGWFYTGDIGEMVEGKFLKITDRKKEIFKTSGGKYIAPQPIENKLKEDHLIEQIMVVGPGRKFAAALIVPSFVNLKKWCEENKVPFHSNERVITEPAVLALYHSIIEKYNPQFNHVEQIKKIVLLPNEWSIGTGELTPKLSLKRKAIMEKYNAEIDAIYA